MEDPFFERFAAAAASIDERLSGLFLPQTGQKPDADLAAARLAAWCKSCASGDWQLFARRLAHDGWSLEEALPRLGTVRRNPDHPLPSWLSDSRWVLAALSTPPEAGADTASLDATAQASPPFADALQPLAFEVERRRDDRLDPQALLPFRETALSDLRDILLRQLTECLAPALYENFRKHHPLPRQVTGGEGAAQAAPLPSSRVNYLAYLDSLRGGGWVALFSEKPVLLRLIASICRQWIEASAEFIARFHADLNDLAAFSPGTDQPVRHVAAGLSDLHNFGRSVFRLDFEGGARLIYKPKDLHPEARVQDLVAWLNRKGAPVMLRGLRVLPRNDYGWSEFIAHEECGSAAEVPLFYEKTGGWLALLHLLVGSDMHEENIIAAGSDPVPIDLEMILQARQAEARSGAAALAAYEAAVERLQDSVLLTGFLPAYSKAPDTRVANIGGMNENVAYTMVDGWAAINTDAMAPTKIRTRVAVHDNLPRYSGMRIGMGDHCDSLIRGFNAYATFLSQSRAEIMAAGLLPAFAGLHIRKVLRPTQFYGLLLARLKDHRNMADGAIWSSHLDFMARFADWDQPNPPFWALQAAERQALANLNIPFFRSRSDGGEIADVTGVTVPTGDMPALQRSLERLAGFDEAEVAWQSEIIAISTQTIARSDGTSAIAMRQPADSAVEIAPLQIADLREQAAQVHAALQTHAIRRGEAAAWIGIDWLDDAQAAQLVPIGHDLYNGNTGIAVFLAAYARQSGEAVAADLARAALVATRHRLHSASAARFVRGLGLGGAAGLGSLVYGFTILAVLLADDSLLDEARAAAALFSNDLIAADTQFDVIGGAAGGILGLLKLYRVTGEAAVLERAIRCGDHLLARRPRKDGKAGLWPSGGRALTGFSHGAAGFAYALTMLSRASGRAEFNAAARDCLEFENRHFSPRHNNWPDLRVASGDAATAHWPCQWCHGAGGIGLSRLGMIKLAGASPGDFTSDLEAAIFRVQQSWPSLVDTLCCGNMGNIEFLSEAAAILQRDDLGLQAARRCSGMVNAASQAGDFQWGIGEGRYNPGLFRGMAGLGYTLLRRLEPTLPNLLIWE